MSVRGRIETAIRERVAAATPTLAGDLWGGSRMTVLIARLDVGSTGAVSGEVEALVWAERLDELPAEAVIAALRAPIFLHGDPDVRLRLTAWREELTEAAVVGRLIFSAELLT